MPIFFALFRYLTASGMLLTDSGKETLETLQSRVAASPDTDYTVVVRIAALSLSATWLSSATNEVKTLRPHPDILEAIGRRFDEVTASTLRVTDIVNILSLWPLLANVENKTDRLQEIGR